MRVRFVRDVLTMAGSSAGSGAVFFAYALLCARFLGVADFGLFQSLMSVRNALMLLAAPLRILTVHLVGGAAPERQANLTGACARMAFGIGVCCAAVVLVGARLFQAVLGSASVWPFVWMAALVLVQPAFIVLMASVEGRNRFVASGLAYLLQAVLVLAFGACALRAGMGVAGAVSGYAISMAAVALGIGLRPGWCRLERGSRLDRGELRSLLKPVAASASLVLVISCPVFIARARLDPTSSGLIGALYTLRNVVQPFALAAAIPLYARTRAKEGEPWMLLKALGVVAALAAGILLVGAVCPELFMRLLYGRGYVAAAPFLFGYAVFLSLNMFATLLVYHQLARDDFAIAPLAVPVLVVAALFFVPDLTIRKIVNTQIAAWAAYMAAALLWEFGRRARRARAPGSAA